MFARATDASKVALARGVEVLRARQFELIDCQVSSAHIASLGAVTMPRASFLQRLTELCEPPGAPESWR
jgi:leucyl/phenylalanyl-tRNA--protein transferase